MFLKNIVTAGIKDVTKTKKKKIETRLYHVVYGQFGNS